MTRSGRGLAYCAVGAYAQSPTLRAGPLAQLLTTMQDLAGHPPGGGYVELSGVGIVLLEGYQVVVGVLCEPNAAQVANGGGWWSSNG